MDHVSLLLKNLQGHLYTNKSSFYYFKSQSLHDFRPTSFLNYVIWRPFTHHLLDKGCPLQPLCLSYAFLGPFLCLEGFPCLAYYTTLSYVFSLSNSPFPSKSRWQCQHYRKSTTGAQERHLASGCPEKPLHKKGISLCHSGSFSQILLILFLPS